jgi:hypothetical protein
MAGYRVALGHEQQGTLACIGGAANSRNQGAARLLGHACICNTGMATSALGWDYEAFCAASALNLRSERAEQQDCRAIDIAALVPEGGLLGE